MSELVLIFLNWEIPPKISHFQLPQEDLMILPTPCPSPTFLHRKVPTLHSTAETCSGPENIRGCNHQPVFLGSQCSGASQAH